MRTQTAKGVLVDAPSLRHCPCLRDGAVDMTLSDDEMNVLSGLLQNYLPELKFEMARSEPGPLRHVLVTRQTLCERLLLELARSARDV